MSGHPYDTDRKYRGKRQPGRLHYDQAVVHSLLDEALMGHLGFAGEAGDVMHVIPLYFVRDGESVLLHGSAKSGALKAARRGAQMCLTVSHLDAVILARSGFHHSVRYRSAAIHGIPEILEGDEKRRALDLMVDRLSPARSKQVRPPSMSEFRASGVLRLALEQVSAKVSQGGVRDEPEDMDLPVWAGVVPVMQHFGEPEVDEGVAPSLLPPPMAFVPEREGGGEKA